MDKGQFSSRTNQLCQSELQSIALERGVSVDELIATAGANLQLARIVHQKEQSNERK